MNDKTLVIDPFEPTCLSGAGYDLRMAMDERIQAGQSQLVATLERVELGSDLVGTLHIRSSLARSGILASLALVDPGFRGQLTILLHNSSVESFEAKRGDRFLQLALHMLSMKTRRPYQGRYQDSRGIVERR
jgi:deoxycytidine triphosphate deaminase